MRHKISYEDNTYKYYTLLWEKYAKAMQYKIESRSEYDSSI